MITRGFQEASKKILQHLNQTSTLWTLHNKESVLKVKKIPNKDVEESINYFLEYCSSYQETIVDKFKRNNLNIDVNEIYKYYLTNGKCSMEGVYISIQDDKIVGFDSLIMTEDSSLLKSRYYFPEFRGNGISTLISKKIVLESLMKGYTIVSVTDKINIPANRSLDKLKEYLMANGYCNISTEELEDGSIKRVFSPGIDKSVNLSKDFATFFLRKINDNSKLLNLDQLSNKVDPQSKSKS